MYHPKSVELVQKLKSGGLIGANCASTFSLLGVTVNGLDKSVVGYVLQGWLAEWMKTNKFYFRTPTNSQDPPDFYLTEKNNEGLLEVKTFDGTKSANFDISNFEAYLQLLLDSPNHLNADYLIMSYVADSSNEVAVREIWLKKIWEITGPSAEFPIKVQQKRKVIYNIRPSSWASARARFKPFDTRENFLNGLYWTLNTYRGAKAAEAWRLDFNKASGLGFTV
jgi:NgoBV restriction endonuclease